jgi:hypothetical protein
MHTRHTLVRRGLSCTVVAKNTNDLTAITGDIDVFDRELGTEGVLFAKILDFE